MEAAGLLGGHANRLPERARLIAGRGDRSGTSENREASMIRCFCNPISESPERCEPCFEFSASGQHPYNVHCPDCLNCGGGGAMADRTTLRLNDIPKALLLWVLNFGFILGAVFAILVALWMA